MKRKPLFALTALLAFLALFSVAVNIWADAGDFTVEGDYEMNEGTVVFGLNVANSTEESMKDAVVIAVAYKNGRLAGAGCEKADLGALSVTPVTVTFGLDGTENAEFVIVLWEGFGTMKPLAAANILTPGYGGTPEPGETPDPGQTPTPAPIYTSEPDPVPTPYTESLTFEPNDEVLINPHIGFTTFMQFNGPGGFKQDGNFLEFLYEDFIPGLDTLDNGENYPDTSIAYVRIYWHIIEPVKEKYNWELIDRCLRLAEQREQTLMFRIMCYDEGNPVPKWFSDIPGTMTPIADPQWKCNNNSPIFVENFSRLVKAFAERYDGHRYLDSVDISFCGDWGEQLAMNKMNDDVMEALIKAYVENFNETPLISYLSDVGTGSGSSGQNDNKNENLRLLDMGGKAGYRSDSFGDMGFYSKNWNYMIGAGTYGFSSGTFGYPWAIRRANERALEKFGVEMWKLGTVSFEAAGVMSQWYNPAALPVKERFDINLIIDKANEWHTSSFNGKSSDVPAEWWPNVYKWMKMMGYRFSLSKIEYSDNVRKNGSINVKSTWHNLGVAPIYHSWYEVAYRLKGPGGEYVFTSKADIREWMPGDWTNGTYGRDGGSGKIALIKAGVLGPSPDWITEDTFTLPNGIGAGKYELQVAIVNAYSKNPDRPEYGQPVGKTVPGNVYIENGADKKPMVRLANGNLDGDGINTDRDGDGWFTVGELNIY